VSDPDDLSELSARIHAAFSTAAYTNFNATYAFSFTWSYKESTLLQLVLCTDTHNNISFLIASYAQLGIPSERVGFFCDTDSHCVTYVPSTDNSTCNVSGQFIFQLNEKQIIDQVNFYQNNFLKHYFYY
jgi:hypothetical protein